MTALIIIGALAILIVLLGAAGSGTPAPPPRPAERRRAPPDPMLDTDIDPLVEPWSDDPPRRG